jgi:Arc/MetJ family transcription regulator
MYTSIKAQLKGVTDQELAAHTLKLQYFNGKRATVYTVLRSVSSSGMTRHISLKVAQGDDIYDITYLAAQAMGDKLHDRNGWNTIKVNGCGMDMGFSVVYNLSSVLFAGQERAGYKIAQRWL